ncbi:hypothetical protein D3C81_2223510 [compost metagenome]
MFATSYQDWYDQAISIYKELNKVLAEVKNEQILKHIRHQEGVVEVQYSNGKSIIVNYTDQKMTIGGLEIDAESYWIGGTQP